MANNGKQTASLTQEQRLQQKLMPLQVRFVRMLEMSGPEIEEEVRRAVDEMPALEVADSNDDHFDASATQDGTPFSETAEQMQLADYGSEDDIPDYASRDSIPSYRLNAGNYSGSEGFYDPVIADNSETLIDSLRSQLRELDLDDREMRIADYIIGNLDDNGYLDRTPVAIADDLAITEDLPATVDEVRRVWQIVRSLEPAGIAAVDLRDCLRLQLLRLPDTKDNATALEIISNYFDLFSKKHFDRICSSLGISRNELQDAVAAISRLNPKPGGSLGSGIPDSSAHITPDFSVDTDPEGALTVTLLNNIPELRIERTFAEDTPLPNATERQKRDARLFIHQKRDDAANFIKLLSMRQETLFRVMAAIVKLQRNFFLSGDEGNIRPMILKDVGALTGYDLSVISRATQGKYVMTRFGIFPLKLFFNEKTGGGEDDEEFTSRQIIAEIKAIIAAEDKNHPLSDEQITARMKEMGFEVARRTVAKYREKIGLPVARLRRQL